MQILFRNILKELLQDSENILDVGCGRNSPLKFVKHGFKIGVDNYEPYIEESQKNQIHSKYIKSDIRFINQIKNRLGEIDAIVCCEVLEHLNKAEGNNLLDDFEILGAKIIIITTPNGFMECEAGELDNPNEKHISGWDIDDFTKRGYEVHGINGSIWKRPFIYNNPSQAKFILAVKSK